MRPGAVGQISGNQQVIEMLEMWLGEAKKGQIAYMGLFAAEYPSIKSWGYAGITDLEPLGLESLENLVDEIKRQQLNRTLPPRDPNLDAGYVCYNCANAPMGHDFLVWLIDAEMTRRREGAGAPLKVAFFFGREVTTGLRGHEQMFFNVYRELVKLVGAVETEAAMGGRHKKLYVLHDITKAALAGEEVPVLRASDMARDIVKPWFEFGRRPVTLTFREADHWPHRNNNMKAWLRFAEYLRKRGERVVIVRDTKFAKEPFHGFECCPAASVNTDIRMALYETAKCNVLVANGPCGLCLFAPMPYLYFVSIDPDDPHPPNRPGFWEKANGIPEGGQLPWAGQHQRFIWKQDTYENLVDAWEEFELSQSIARCLTTEEEHMVMADAVDR